MKSSKFALALLLPTLTLLSACASKSGDGLETAPVTVTLTLDGSPLADARIAFVPPQNPVPAAGTTDANGVAKLTTYTTGDGAVLGNHNVMVLKSEVTGAAAADQDSTDYDPNAPAQKVKNLIPAKYNNPGTSGFSAEVKKGKNEFKFDLLSK
jgi:hypothetical protein